jgi:hypothetical protein
MERLGKQAQENERDQRLEKKKISRELLAHAKLGLLGRLRSGRSWFKTNPGK